MRRLFWLGVFLICGSLWAGPEVVKIGVNVHMADTGQAGNGEELRTALMMAADELNARPTAPYRYQLIFENNGYTPKGAVLAARKLIAIDNVDMMYTIYDFAVAPVAAIARQEKIANFGGCAWGVKYADGETTFLFCPSEEAFAKALYSAAKLKEVPTAIVGIRQAATPNFVEAVQKLRKAEGKAPYEVIYFNPGEIEFRSTLLKLQEKGIQRIILVAFGNEMNKFLYQMKMNPGYRPELMGFDFGLPMAEDRAMVVGSLVAAGVSKSEAFEKKFDKYKKHKDLKPAESVIAYDGLKMLAQALEELPPSAQQKPMRERILQALKTKQTFEGYSGNYTKTGGVFDTPAWLMKITHTGLEPYTP